MKNKNKNTTLSEIVQNLIEKYHTVGNSSKYNRKIPHCRNSSKSNRKIPLSEIVQNTIEKYHTVGIVQNIIEKYHTVGIVQNIIEKYHTVGNSSKSNRKIPHCRK